jgi:hypothetical protein
MGLVHWLTFTVATTLAQPVVQTDCGAVLGSFDVNLGSAFLGIPFAVCLDGPSVVYRHMRWRACQMPGASDPEVWHALPALEVTQRGRRLLARHVQREQLR